MPVVYPFPTIIPCIHFHRDYFYTIQLAQTSTANASDYLKTAVNLTALNTTQFKTPADEFFQ